MKWILFILSVVYLGFTSCSEKEGYLITENAIYEPDTMVIHLNPDPELDAIRIEYESPWQSLAMQGYQGTKRIDFSVESVTSTAGVDHVGWWCDELSLQRKISCGTLYGISSFDWSRV